MKKKLSYILFMLSFSAIASACTVRRLHPDMRRQKAQQNEDTQKGQGGEGEEVHKAQGEQQEQNGTPQTEPYEAQLPTGKEEAEIFVEPVEDISEDFIRGMDVSSVISLEESGVSYYNRQGEEEDLFRILADAGINYIRTRVWNDPYDADGSGYGGGDSDVEKAARIGARAAQNGMKLLVDFHYSDFWADLEHQKAPKAWKHMPLQEKQEALYHFTKESLKAILDAGGDVGIVQTGNEINDGLAGEQDWEDRLLLLAQAGRAVRETAQETGHEIRIAVHFTNLDDHDRMMDCAKTLAQAGLDYDIFGVSYYPYRHGTMEHMKTVLKNIRSMFEKDTLILETAYCHTLEDADGSANCVGDKDLIHGYAATVQSQASCVRDIMAAASEAMALGVFYEEGAWIPAGPAAKEEGGCPWENQAMFDADGHPLASLDVFRYLEYGTSCEKAVDYVKEARTEVRIGEQPDLPQTVNAVYNDRSLNGPVPVVWDQAQVDRIRTDRAGEYVVNGRLEDGTDVNCSVIVSKKNWLLNPGFEQNDISMWKVSYQGESNPTQIQKKEADARSGENSFYFRSDGTQEFQIEQTVSGLEAGKYTVSVHIQGDAGSAAQIYLYALVRGKRICSEMVKLDGWGKWKKPRIKGLKLNPKTPVTVGMKVTGADGWGAADDFVLIRAGK